MLNAGLPANEDLRLRELHALQVLDTPPEERFDRLARLACRTFSSAAAWISFLDATHQHFKAQYGITLPDLPREHSIGAHVISSSAPLVICDVQMDPRFADSPVLESRPEICFYAAAPLLVSNTCIGLLAISDSHPRRFSSDQQRLLEEFARLVSAELIARREEIRLTAERTLIRSSALILHCLACEGLPIPSPDAHVQSWLGLKPAGGETSILLENFIHPEDRPSLLTCVREAVNGHGGHASLTLRLLPARGEMRWMRGNLCRNNGGNKLQPPLLSLCLIDVSRSVLLENESHIERQRFELALEAADLGTWHIDFSTGLRHADARTQGIVGEAAMPDIHPLSQWFTRLHPQDLANTRAALDAHLNGRSAHYAAEYRLRHRLGHYVWVLSHGKLIDRDEQGAPRQMQGIHLDVTAQRHASAEQDWQRRLFKLLSDAQQHFLRETDDAETLQRLIGGLLDLCECRFGLFGESVPDQAGQLDVRATCLRDKSSHVPQPFGALRRFAAAPDIVARMLGGNAMISNEACVHDWAASEGIIPPLENVLGLPCTLDGEVLGLLILGDREQGFDHYLLARLAPLGFTLGLMIHARRMASARASAEQALRAQAATDELTGILNRRAFMARASEALSAFRRYGHAFCVLIIDLDHFKRINDTYGHAAGDAALRAVTACIGQSLRESDVFGRIGGEEFAILLPCTHPEEGPQLAERLRETVARLALPPLAGGGHVSFSAGLCASYPEVRRVDELLSRADAALYEAKAAGRNRIVVAQPPTPDPA